MSRRAPILGITGLIFLLFGTIEHWMTLVPGRGYFDFGWFAMAHLATGVACLIWYFSAGSGSLSGFISSRSTRYGTNALVYSVLFVGVIAMANFLAVRYHHRIDVSAAGVNSLSEQSERVLGQLESNVEILAFVGPDDREFVQSVAEIYGYGSERIGFRIIDPQVNPELTQREHVTQMPTLKVTLGDSSTMIHKIDEESITNAIHRVSTVAQKKIYFIEGHGEPALDDDKGPAGMGAFADNLRNQNYIVEPLFLAEAGSVPEDADVVIAAAADRAYFPAEVTALRGYLQSGGHLLFLLEPLRNPELAELLSEAGIVAGDDVILDQQVRLFEGVSLGLSPVVSSYGQHPAVEPIKDRTVFSTARSMAPAGPPTADLAVAAIAMTAQTSWAETDIERVFSDGEAKLEEGDRAGPVPLGVAASGSVAALGGSDETEFRLVAFGDSSFLTNQYLRQLFNDALGLSVVGWLAGEQELISIGPRVLRASRAYLGDGETRTVFYLSVLIIPELILLAGITVWWRRSSL